MRRPNKHHPELPPRHKLRNRLIAKVRAAVERPFAVFKECYGMRRMRFFSLAANRTQCTLAAFWQPGVQQVNITWHCPTPDECRTCDIAGPIDCLVSKRVFPLARILQGVIRKRVTDRR
ncbi:hypothetical protein CIT26_19920 [Mesorhizobium temperatum]|uniref:Transposase DDE domain-containing protein n=2 Tax=Mesorhizobium temperatum TaxID=241416 RepID=A0A271LJY3_9HYPH|nr:hypothetical protein [Mesorhizobium temperatum]PAQ07610.1 hypothetical protein CIT26_19920 [Mesorhizobium temperatum]